MNIYRVYRDVQRREGTGHFLNMIVLAESSQEALGLAQEGAFCEGAEAWVGATVLLLGSATSEAADMYRGIRKIICASD
jgi:hypothetical protein